MAVEKDAREVMRHYPPIDEDRTDVRAPVVKVTLLEDRAQVRRSSRVRVVAGHNRLIVRDVAPVLQDVSLQGAVTGQGKVADVRVRRAMRVTTQDKPEHARKVEEELRALEKSIRGLSEDRARYEERQRRVVEVLGRGVQELPEDVGWGSVNHQAWRDTFESLFKKSRSLTEESLAKLFEQQQLLKDWNRLRQQRQLFDRPDVTLVAWLEVDVAAEETGELELVLDYVVPNALWRPLHSARLVGGEKPSLEFSSSATVWQNTGEDWEDVDLVFSTARSSLGHEPPLLSDDLLRAQKKREEVVVQAREVAVQKASVSEGSKGGGGSVLVDLPGVDDGGETQTLKARSKASVPSNGRPTMVPVFEFRSEADPRLVAAPELENKVFLRSVQKNEGSAPILAGPVELVRDSGVVGWTKVLFVAPGEEFELGFGPEEDVRLNRVRQNASDTDPLDKWQINVALVQIYLSNLGEEPKRVEITERFPISEIEEVKVTLLDDKTSGGYKVDKNGFCTWSVDVGSYGQKKLQLAWALGAAPGVTGL